MSKTRSEKAVQHSFLDKISIIDFIAFCNQKIKKYLLVDLPETFPAEIKREYSGCIQDYFHNDNQHKLSVYKKIASKLQLLLHKIYEHEINSTIIMEHLGKFKYVLGMCALADSNFSYAESQFSDGKYFNDENEIGLTLILAQIYCCIGMSNEKNYIYKAKIALHEIENMYQKNNTVQKTFALMQGEIQKYIREEDNKLKLSVRNKYKKWDESTAEEGFDLAKDLINPENAYYLTPIEIKNIYMSLLFDQLREHSIILQENAEGNIERLTVNHTANVNVLLSSFKFLNCHLLLMDLLNFIKDREEEGIPTKFAMLDELQTVYAEITSNDPRYHSDSLLRAFKNYKPAILIESGMNFNNEKNNVNIKPKDFVKVSQKESAPCVKKLAKHYQSKDATSVEVNKIIEAFYKIDELNDELAQRIIQDCKIMIQFGILDKIKSLKSISKQNHFYLSTLYYVSGLCAVHLDELNADVLLFEGMHFCKEMQELADLKKFFQCAIGYYHLYFDLPIQAKMELAIFANDDIESIGRKLYNELEEYSESEMTDDPGIDVYLKELELLINKNATDAVLNFKEKFDENQQDNITISQEYRFSYLMTIFLFRLKVEPIKTDRIPDQDKVFMDFLELTFSKSFNFIETFMDFMKSIQGFYSSDADKKIKLFYQELRKIVSSTGKILFDSVLFSYTINDYLNLSEQAKIPLSANKKKKKKKNKQAEQVGQESSSTSSTSTSSIISSTPPSTKNTTSALPQVVITPAALAKVEKIETQPSLSENRKQRRERLQKEKNAIQTVKSPLAIFTTQQIAELKNLQEELAKKNRKLRLNGSFAMQVAITMAGHTKKIQYNDVDFYSPSATSTEQEDDATEIFNQLINVENNQLKFSKDKYNTNSFVDIFSAPLSNPAIEHPAKKIEVVMRKQNYFTSEFLLAVEVLINFEQLQDGYPSLELIGENPFAGKELPIKITIKPPEINEKYTSYAFRLFEFIQKYDGIILITNLENEIYPKLLEYYKKSLTIHTVTIENFVPAPFLEMHDFLKNRLMGEVAISTYLNIFFKAVLSVQNPTESQKSLSELQLKAEELASFAREFYLKDSAVFPLNKILFAKKINLLVSEYLNGSNKIDIEFSLRHVDLNSTIIGVQQFLLKKNLHHYEENIFEPIYNAIYTLILHNSNVEEATENNMNPFVKELIKFIVLFYNDGLFNHDQNIFITQIKFLISNYVAASSFEILREGIKKITEPERLISSYPILQPTHVSTSVLHMQYSNPPLRRAHVQPRISPHRHTVGTLFHSPSTHAPVKASENNTTTHIKPHKSKPDFG